MEEQRFFSAIKRVLGTHTLEDTYQTATNEILSLFKGKYSSILIKKENSFERTYTNYSLLERIIPRSSGTTAKAIWSKSPFVCPKKDCHPLLQKIPFDSILFLPLLHEDYPIGVLTMISPNPIPLNQDSIYWLKLFGSIISAIIIRNLATEELKKQINQLRLVSSIASHEIRSNLNIVNCYTQLILNNALQSPLLDWGTKLKQGVHQCSRLLEETLEKNNPSLSLTGYCFKECFFSDLIKNNVETIKHVYPEYCFNLEDQTDSRSRILADTDKLSQVITNLLSNSVKFSPVDKVITIKLDEIKTGPRKVQMQIIDHGQGISKAAFPHLGNQFFRATDSVPGKGLGLFLVKQIVHRHQGKINITSQESQGTTIRIAFPTI